ncbi:hypothetical protein N657DRAFT_646849 [Parathielavia appendiculata]|uniref:Uncharacterized protein n=1 Tax=Parathielavia appendiculata TaxID=2587402 RepID=A0AAN6TX62_9PEZI|nr:hypothetical protein N657DRAFT_646849 [Parathielavia appendiculata]
MQRSLSSPVAIHPSPRMLGADDVENPDVVSLLTCLPATAAPDIPVSRSPTPSPSDSHVEASRARRLRSRSPPRVTNDFVTATGRRNDDLPRHPSVLHIPSSNSARTKPIIDQQSTQSTAAGPRDSSDSLETTGLPPALPDDSRGNLKFLRPLLADVSLYTNHNLGPEKEGTSLEELAHLVRLSKYQERKRANTRIRLQRSLVSTALSARLMRCGEMAYRNLVDGFRGDDKKTFAALYNAVIDVRRSCDETRRYALLESEMELLQPPGLVSSESLETPTGSVSGANVSPNAAVTHFFNEISASARETFLNFLTHIRTNPDYLATRIASLRNSELAALTSFHQTLEPIESVLPYHSRSPARGSSANPTFSGSGGAGGAGKERSAIERLLSFQRHDPISALIYTCFANSAGPDSAEDKRRTMAWANACARLISAQTTGSEQTVISVLNIWVSMRDWAGKSNMEWYLMKILEDGAFLLDRAEDQHGTRFNLSDWSTKDQIAADEFYTKAVDELFEVIDDEDSTGIPEGLLELGNEILKRLDKKYAERTRLWLVSKYLFTVWLLGVVIHPETYGMMAEYHITEYGRQKILKTVAMQAQKYVVDMLHSKTPVSTPPKVKGHVQNIYSRFKDPSGYRKKPRLLPARSITSLRETAEVRPYLVISPADLATLVNALFPERRPRSAHSSGVRSGAPSLSGFSSVSQPMSIRTAPSTFDTMSVLSTSAESSFSDATTSREPLLEEESPRHYSPPAQKPVALKPNTYEEDGYRLRLAMHEMTQTLGQDIVYGLCHPCAERWAVLFISPDGNKLSTQMTFDPDDETENDENSSDNSETEGEDTDDGRPELDKDYHQLRDSILKLVQEYEIPQSLENDGTKQQTFSNRASTLKKYRHKNRIITTMGSRNPYRQRAASIASSIAESPTEGAKGKEVVDQAVESSSPLITMLTAACSQSRAQSDFVSAHLYWRTLQQLNALTSESLRREGFSALLSIFSRGPRDSIRSSAAAIEEYDAWLIWLKQSQERAEGQIESMMRRLRALRDKMWYVTDVRNSAPYEDSRNVAAALKTMGAPRRWSSFQRIKSHMQRGPASNYIFKTESQILDLLAAPEDQGGPNKLRDEQAEKTARWLQQYGVENFCQGEERIHRFCCEVDNCVSKLVGDSIIDGPVLWSSELFSRDRQAFETNKTPRDRDRDRDNQSVWDDSISVVSDPDRRFVSVSRPASVNSRDLRTLSGHNVSQMSLDSSRFSFSRASTAMSEVLDGSEYFGASSPVHQIDYNATFWSPFQNRAASPSATSRAHSPTTSLTNLSGSFHPPHHQQLPSQSQQSTGRPGTSASSNETVYQQRLSDEKSRFLADLRQTLTSLLLSDLGNLVFARGSETDAWFEGLGQECIDRREAIQRRTRKALAKDKRRSVKSGLNQRSLENNRSFGDSRGTTGDDALSDRALSDTQSIGPDVAGGSQRGSQHGSIHGGSIHGNESSVTSDTISARRSNKEPRKESMPDFPFTKAYQRLLKMFCVHPNPYVKLNALFELEHLIVASLNSGSRRARLAWARSELGSASSATEEHGVGAVGGRSQPLEETIDNVKERRSQTLMQAPNFGSGGHAQAGRVSGGGGNTEARSVVSVYPANTDAIANILRSLFRDPSLRPKTLFRDLQFISAFVPATVLDKTERGKAFWDASIAALSLKQDVCRTMVEVADEIVKNYTQSRNGTSSAVVGKAPSSTASDSAAEQPPLSPPTSPPSPLPLSTHSLADAARMWTITAKEGDPTAQRELAIFYLSNPELVQRTTLPLSKPREVFKQAVIEKYGGSGSGSRSGGLVGSGSRYQHHHGHGHLGGGPGRMMAQGSVGGTGAGQAGIAGSGVGGGGGGGSGAVKEDAAGLGDVRSDPALMCVAIHWMEAAERGGDELARTFMAQNEIGAGLMG